jgi:uncharacterized damage-inducible protein DinB
MSECSHIAEELRSTFEGNAWYGDSVQKILDGVTAKQASARPINSAHSIWELVNHVSAWAVIAFNTISGMAMPKMPMATERDFPPPNGTDEAAWQESLRYLLESNRKLCSAIENFEDQRLSDTVPGRSYNFYHLFQGMAQHAVYHAGQISLLKKAQS